MIQIKSFPISDEGTSDFNAFIKKHPPMATEKQSGIIFHQDHVLVVYNDGVHNPEELRSLARTLCEGDRHKKFLAEHSKKNAEVALKHEKYLFDTKAPHGYKTTMTNGEVRKILSKEGNTAYIPEETITELRQGFDAALGRIQSLENQILMDEHEISRLGFSIEAYEEMQKS